MHQPVPATHTVRESVILLGGSSNWLPIRGSPEETYKKEQYVVPTKLSEVKEPMYEDIAHALMDMQTQEFKTKLALNAWGELFDKCFGEEFQNEATLLVAADLSAGKSTYFSSAGGVTIDPVMGDTSGDAVLATMDAQDGESHTRELDAAASGKAGIGMVR